MSGFFHGVTVTNVDTGARNIALPSSSIIGLVDTFTEGAGVTAKANDLVLITSEDHRTAPLGLAFFKGAHLTDYSLLSAAGVIVALPIVVLYFFLQKRFISGMLGGFADR